MRARTTNMLLAAIALMLAAQLVRPHVMVSNARADETAKIPEVVRARMIELVDDRGQVRANLKVESNGEAVFRMRDSKGILRVKLGASEEGAGLLLTDDQTEPAVHILAKRESTTLTLSEKGKEKRVIRP